MAKAKNSSAPKSRYAQFRKGLAKFKKAQSMPKKKK